VHESLHNKSHFSHVSSEAPHPNMIGHKYGENKSTMSN